MATDTTTEAAIDDIFNFDSTDDEDPFKDTNTNNKSSRSNGDDNNKPGSSPDRKRKAEDGEGSDSDLGINKEVKITKKRKPIAKLDEARLLSAPGIPKLRALARSGKFSKKLRLKGKGHEFSDVARLLNYYQLWLDNLYPRAKFADGLQMVEKVGHSKRMQIMRKEWIDEGKPGYARKWGRKDDELDDQDGQAVADDWFGGSGKPVENSSKPTPSANATTAVDAGTGGGDSSLFIPDSRSGNNDPPQGEDTLPDDDELEALLAEQDAITTAVGQQKVASTKPTADVDSEGEDDLDALLAEQESRRTVVKSSNPPAAKIHQSPFDDGDDEEGMIDDDDDLDALLAEQEVRHQPSSSKAANQTPPQTSSKPPEPAEVDDEEDDLEALLAEQEARQSTSRAHASVENSMDNLETLPGTTHDNDVNEEDGGGEAMFLSSPVRTTQRSRAGGDSTSNSDRAATLPEQARAQEDTEDLEAGDMFSSSPVKG
ncbi:uncharacterized protein PV06_00882 [Exophiala oligosperma]|uniref:Chromosome segregation in meiosis protein n=2 Tax=Chaetothyriales TaxID=34395 RepID=A0A0D2CEF4_9EURO|nr:uncharacterized protein PV06_00882 [Exophiala oligosperma]KAJ9633385.1 chromosome segregation in meiosis- protein [Knufia peltigerae]KIW48277.1 hypothetical protein PV06_00882 [Exophiala oligosperma]